MNTGLRGGKGGSDFPKGGSDFPKGGSDFPFTLPSASCPVSPTFDTHGHTHSEACRAVPSAQTPPAAGAWLPCVEVVHAGQ